MILLNRTCFGKLDNKAYYPKVQWAERIPALVLAAIIFILGVQPNWLIRWSEPTTAAMVATVQVNHELLAQNLELRIQEKAKKSS